MASNPSGAKSISRRRLLEAAGALAALPGAAGRARAADLPALRLLTNWFAQAEHAGFYQALATGLYRNNGVDASVSMGGAQINTVQLLLAGACDVVLAQPEQVLKGISNGLPLVAVATSFQKGLGGLLAHPDITALGQLRGHPILISTEGRTTYWPWLKRTYGFDDAQAGVYTFNIQPFLFDPRLAMQSFATSEPYAVSRKNVPYRFFLLADEGYAGYGNMLVTTRAVVENHAPALSAFLRASMQGWKQVLTGDASPARAAVLQANPAMTADQFDWSLAALKRINALGAPGQIFGRMDPARWQRIRDMDVADGLVADTLDWRQGFTTRFDDAMTVSL